MGPGRGGPALVAGRRRGGHRHRPGRQLSADVAAGRRQPGPAGRRPARRPCPAQRGGRGGDPGGRRPRRGPHELRHLSPAHVGRPQAGGHRPRRVAGRRPARDPARGGAARVPAVAAGRLGRRGLRRAHGRGLHGGVRHGAPALHEHLLPRRRVRRRALADRRPHRRLDRPVPAGGLAAAVPGRVLPADGGALDDRRRRPAGAPGGAGHRGAPRHDHGRPAHRPAAPALTARRPGREPAGALGGRRAHGERRRTPAAGLGHHDPRRHDGPLVVRLLRAASRRGRRHPAVRRRAGGDAARRGLQLRDPAAAGRAVRRASARDAARPHRRRHARRAHAAPARREGRGFAADNAARAGAPACGPPARRRGGCRSPRPRRSASCPGLRPARDRRSRARGGRGRPG